MKYRRYMIVVIGGIKGGTGKTTLATNLAVINTGMGLKTLLIDADDQGSASDWADQRESIFIKEGIDAAIIPTMNFPTISLSGKNIYTQINKMKDDYSDIFIDTGGRDTVSQRSALTCADCYLIPFKPRSFDIWTIGKVKEVIEEIQTINPNLKVIVCLNQADSKGADNEDALKILSEVPEFKCITTSLGHRKAFSNAAAQGLGVIELEKQDKKAIEEIYSIHKAIYS